MVLTFFFYVFMHNNHQDYLQPDFYRFSEDSLHLIRTLNELNLINAEKVMDLCAGSGVVGLEYSLRTNTVFQLDFCEIQEEFLHYLKENEKLFLRPGIQSHLYHESYADLRWRSDLKNSYDCVLSNPPYFHPDHGLTSPDENKNRCRFFMDASLEELIEVYIHLLKPNVKGFLVIRNDQKFMNDEIARLSAKFLGKLQITELRKFSSCSVYQLVTLL